MKAILIDPVAHRVSAIEVEYETLSRAFTDGKNQKIALTIARLNLGGVLVTDSLKRMPPQGKWFGLLGSGLAPIFGRGLMLGYDTDGKGYVSTELTVREAEKLVRFGS